MACEVLGGFIDIAESSALQSCWCLKSNTAGHFSEPAVLYEISTPLGSLMGTSSGSKQDLEALKAMRHNAISTFSTKARATAVPHSFQLVQGRRGKMTACIGAALGAAAVQVACKGSTRQVAVVAAACYYVKTTSRLRCPAQPEFGGT